VGGDGAPQGSDVDDAVHDVDHRGDGAYLTRPDHYVCPGHDAGRVRGGVEEGPRQPGLVHGVEVDDEVEGARMGPPHVCSVSDRRASLAGGEGI
jgi:hypothetical protein